MDELTEYKALVPQLVEAINAALVAIDPNTHQPVIAAGPLHDQLRAARSQAIALRKKWSK